MKNRVLLLLFWTMLLDTASYTIRFPVLTLVFFDSSTRLFSISATMATRSWWYGVCMALYWIGLTIAAPILSFWSDYVGRKKVLVFGSFGTLVFALATVFGVLWGSITLILVGSLIGGICSRMDPIAQAAVGDISQPDNKMLYMSYLQLFISIGAIFGPIIGGYFAHRFWFASLNFSLSFMIAAVFAALGLVILVKYFRETAAVHAAASISKYMNLKMVLSNKKVMVISLLLILIQLSWSTYYQFIAPILKKTFDFGGTEIGFFVGIIAVWLALASAFGIQLLQRFLSIQKIIYYATFAILIGLIGTLLVTLFHQFSWLKFMTWVFAIPIAAGDVITYCAITTLYSNAVEKTAQGQVMGANFIIVSAVWGLTSLLGGLLLGVNPALPLCFALIGVGLLIVLFMKRKDALHLLF